MLTSAFREVSTGGTDNEDKERMKAECLCTLREFRRSLAYKTIIQLQLNPENISIACVWEIALGLVF